MSLQHARGYLRSLTDQASKVAQTLRAASPGTTDQGEMARLWRDSWFPQLARAASRGQQDLTLETDFRMPATHEQQEITKFLEDSGFSVNFGQIKNGYEFGSQYDLRVTLVW